MIELNPTLISAVYQGYSAYGLLRNAMSGLTVVQFCSILLPLEKERSPEKSENDIATESYELYQRIDYRGKGNITWGDFSTFCVEESSFELAELKRIPDLRYTYVKKPLPKLFEDNLPQARIVSLKFFSDLQQLFVCEERSRILKVYNFECRLIARVHINLPQLIRANANNAAGNQMNKSKNGVPSSALDELNAPKEGENLEKKLSLATFTKSQRNDIIRRQQQEQALKWAKETVDKPIHGRCGREARQAAAKIIFNQMSELNRRNDLSNPGDLEGTRTTRPKTASQSPSSKDRGALSNVTSLRATAKALERVHLIDEECRTRNMYQKEYKLTKEVLRKKQRERIDKVMLQRSSEQEEKNKVENVQRQRRASIRSGDSPSKAVSNSQAGGRNGTGQFPSVPDSAPARDPDDFDKEKMLSSSIAVSYDAGVTGRVRDLGKLDTEATHIDSLPSYARPTLAHYAENNYADTDFLLDIEYCRPLPRTNDKQTWRRYTDDDKVHLLGVSSTDLILTFWKTRNFSYYDHIHITEPQHQLLWSDCGNMLFSCNQTGTVVTVWDILGRAALRLLRGHSMDIQCMVDVERHGMLATAALDCKVMLWRYKDGDLIPKIPSHFATFRRHTKGIRKMVYVPSSNLMVTCGLMSDALVWDPTSLAYVMKLPLRSSNICSILVPKHQHHTVITVDKTAMFKVWYLDDRTTSTAGCIGSFTVPQIAHDAEFMDFAEPHKYLIAGNRTLHLLEMEAIKSLLFFPLEVIFSPIIQVFVTTIRSDMFVFSGRTGETIRHFKNITEEPITSIALHERGREVVIGDTSGNIILTNILNGHCVCVASEPHQKDIISTEFCDGDSCFVSGSWDGSVRVYSTNDDDDMPCVRMIENAHTVGVDCVTVSRELGLIASASSDCSIRIWDYLTLEFVGECKGSAAAIAALTFMCPQKEYPLLLSTDLLGYISVWAVRPSSLRNKLLIRLCNDSFAGGFQKPWTDTTAPPPLWPLSSSATKIQIPISAVTTEVREMHHSVEENPDEPEHSQYMDPLQKREQQAKAKIDDSVCWVITGDSRGRITWWDLTKLFKKFPIDPVAPEQQACTKDNYDPSIRCHRRFPASNDLLNVKDMLKPTKSETKSTERRRSVQFRKASMQAHYSTMLRNNLSNKEVNQGLLEGGALPGGIRQTTQARQADSINGRPLVRDELISKSEVYPWIVCQVEKYSDAWYALDPNLAAKEALLENVSDSGSASSEKAKRRSRNAGRSRASLQQWTTSRIVDDVLPSAQWTGHSNSIVSVKLVRRWQHNGIPVVISASQDFSMRLWTILGQAIGILIEPDLSPTRELRISMQTAADSYQTLRKCDCPWRFNPEDPNIEKEKRENAKMVLNKVKNLQELQTCRDLETANDALEDLVASARDIPSDMQRGYLAASREPVKSLFSPLRKKSSRNKHRNRRRSHEEFDQTFFSYRSPKAVTAVCHLSARLRSEDEESVLPTPRFGGSDGSDGDVEQANDMDIQANIADVTSQHSEASDNLMLLDDTYKSKPIRSFQEYAESGKHLIFPMPHIFLGRYKNFGKEALMEAKKKAARHDPQTKSAMNSLAEEIEYVTKPKSKAAIRELYKRGKSGSVRKAERPPMSRNRSSKHLPQEFKFSDFDELKVSSVSTASNDPEEVRKRIQETIKTFKETYNKELECLDKRYRSPDTAFQRLLEKNRMDARYRRKLSSVGQERFAAVEAARLHLELQDTFESEGGYTPPESFGKYTKNDVIALKRMFDAIDVNGKGEVGVEEFLDSELFSNVNPQTAKSFFRTTDSNRSGTLELEELLCAAFSDANSNQLCQMMRYCEYHGQKVARLKSTLTPIQRQKPEKEQAKYQTNAW